MRGEHSWRKDKRGTGVANTVLAAAEPVAAVDLSVQNWVSNKARDKAWMIGDQAMNKGAVGFTSSINRGCP
jgi:hypothetical protein